jgi:hypothetical protein
VSDGNGGNEYAFELQLPPGVGASISSAQVMYMALMRQGLIREPTGEVLSA